MTASAAARHLEGNRIIEKSLDFICSNIPQTMGSLFIMGTTQLMVGSAEIDVLPFHLPSLKVDQRNWRKTWELFMIEMLDLISRYYIQSWEDESYIWFKN